MNAVLFVLSGSAGVLSTTAVGTDCTWRFRAAHALYSLERAILALAQVPLPSFLFHMPHPGMALLPEVTNPSRNRCFRTIEGPSDENEKMGHV